VCIFGGEVQLITANEKAFQLDRTFQFWHFPTAAYVRLPLVVKIYNFLLTITIHKHLIIDPQSGAKFLSFQQINYGLLDSYFDRVAIGKFMAQAAGLC